jgi:hypothetical protein
MKSWWAEHVAPMWEIENEHKILAGNSLNGTDREFPVLIWTGTLNHSDRFYSVVSELFWDRTLLWSLLVIYSTLCNEVSHVLFAVTVSSVCNRALRSPVRPRETYWTQVTENKNFWEELIAYFPLIRHGPHRKWLLQQFFITAGACLMSRCPATIGGIHIHADWWEGLFFCLSGALLSP